MWVLKYVCLELNGEVTISTEEKKKKKKVNMYPHCQRSVHRSKFLLLCTAEMLKALLSGFLDFFAIPTVFLFAQVKKVIKMYTPLNTNTNLKNNNNKML